MPTLSRYVQTPDERKRYTIDYSEWLDSGETLTDATAAITPVTTPPLVVDDILIIVSSTVVEFYTSGGNDGETYEVLFTIETSADQIKQDEVVFSVREL